MRDILLKDKTAGSGSLPALINLVQYKTDDNISGEVNKSTSVGTMGNNMFAFAIDLPYINGEAVNNFKVLHNLFSQLRYPTISRVSLEKMFYIFEIPDYGHQALSPFYQDFMVMLFRKGGTKILQKYIGHIRSYYNKIMYILVDKEVNIAKNEKFDIRVIFKSGIDKDKNVNSEFEFNKSKNGKFEKTFKAGDDFPFIGKDTTAFDIFLVEGENRKRFINAFNPELFSIEFVDDNNIATLIQPQSNYFGELYSVDFEKQNTIPEVKDDEIKVSITCPTPNSIEKLILKTPQVSPEFIIYSNQKYFDDEYLAFDKDGNYMPSLSITESNKPYELIPIFNKSRLILIESKETEKTLNQLLYDCKNIRYDIKIEDQDYIEFTYNSSRIVYIFDDNLSIDNTIDNELSNEGITIDKPKMVCLKTDTIRNDSVINDPYLTTFEQSADLEGAIHILNIPEKITTDDDITSASFSNDFLDSSDNIIANIKSIADNLLKPYRYIVDTFLVNFLKNSNSEWFNKATKNTKIFLVEMDNANEIIIETKRGKEIIKGYPSADGKYYGITDSEPISGTVKSLF